MEENKNNENIINDNINEKETESVESTSEEVQQENEVKEEVKEDEANKTDNKDEIMEPETNEEVEKDNIDTPKSDNASDKPLIKNQKIDNVFKKCENLVRNNSKLAIIALLTSACFNIYQLSLNTTTSDMHEEKIQELNNLILAKNTEIDSLNSTISDNDTIISNLNEKVADAMPWLELSDKQKELLTYNIKEIKDKEQKEIEAQIQAIKEAEAKRLEEERIAREKAEEEERKAKEKAEKEKYNTGITYKQLARNPEDYKYEYCKFKGKVLQVMEGTFLNQMRIAVNGNYDNVLYVTYNPRNLDSRILEDDYVTVYGKSTGIYSYKSVLGATISIPSLSADKVEM